MSKPEPIETIMENLPRWEFIQRLPRELQGFTFQMGGRLEENELLLCSYVNEAEHRRLDLIYTKETFDYVPVKGIGLHRFRDIRYITRDKEEFAQVIPEVLPRILEELQPDFVFSSQPMLIKKGIIQWEYPNKLPDKIGRFEKFITPGNYLDFINDSTIFLDYVDFEKGNELVFLYNRIRNEFFAESKTSFFPNTIHDFDADTLEELQNLLEKKLESYLLSWGEKGEKA